MEEFFWIMVGLAVIGTIFLLYKVCIKDYNGTSNTNNASTKKQSIDVGFVQRIEITTNLQKAKFLAEKIGKISLYKRYEDDIAKMIYIHSGKQNIIDAEIYYFVYGVHGKIENEAAGLFFGDLFTNTEFLAKVHMPVISLITDTPPKDMSPDRYASLICDLFVAMEDDAKFLAVYDRYGYEYPERLKKLLTSNIDTLVETAFYSVAMTIQSSNAKYLNKGFANLNFILYYCANYHDVLFSEDMGEEKKEHYENLLKMHFCEYAEMMKIIQDKDKAEAFFASRYGKYKSIDTSDDATNLETIREVVDYTKITQYLNENAKNDILVEMSELMSLLNENAKPYFEKMACFSSTAKSILSPLLSS